MDKHKYRFKYEYSYPFGDYPMHIWSCVGAKGAVHFWVKDYGEERGKQYRERYGGGIEIHYRYPPNYMNTPPSHDNCWLLGGPCWHDGSSLQASRHWIPLWLSANNNHEIIFEELETEMESTFEEESDD